MRLRDLQDLRHSPRLLIEPRSYVKTFDNRSRREDGATTYVDASVRSLEPRRRDGEPRTIRLAQKCIKNVIHLLLPFCDSFSV
jgi:hypothetical protein